MAGSNMAEAHRVITEDRLTFSFPDGIKATKYDDWSFYRNQFNHAFGGSKATDLIAIDGNTTWLVEIKDYRQHRRTKPIDLGDEVAIKVRDTLAGLTAAQCTANDAAEKQFARRALKTTKWQVVLHLEQPQKQSKLFPRAINPADVLQKLKQKLKAIDAHPKVVDQDSLTSDMRWTVQG